jgi:hypothetical protein
MTEDARIAVSASANRLFAMVEIRSFSGGHRYNPSLKLW